MLRKMGLQARLSNSVGQNKSASENHSNRKDGSLVESFKRCFEIGKGGPNNTLTTLFFSAFSCSAFASYFSLVSFVLLLFCLCFLYSEHCLVGLKGHPPLNRNIDCEVLVAEVRETSRKPDEIYGIADRLAPNCRKLGKFLPDELFALLFDAPISCLVFFTFVFYCCCFRDIWSPAQYSSRVAHIRQSAECFSHSRP